MIEFAAGVARAGRNQGRNLLNLLRGRPVVTPSFASMTLDEDDVAVAREWLGERSRWSEEDIVRRFESTFARWNGSQHAFAFDSGRTALSACINALGLSHGDEVIIPGYTCVAVPNAFRFEGVTVIYSDIELETFGLDVSVLEQKLTRRTRAILLHHLYGLVCRDYLAIIELARRNGLAVIEDCAHATGAEFQHTKVGNLGDVAIFSSEHSKVFNTIQGGVAVSNREDLAARLKAYQDRSAWPDAAVIHRQLMTVLLNFYRYKHPTRWLLGDVTELRYGKHQIPAITPEEEQGVRPPGYGCRMPAPLAALGTNQLSKIDHYNATRRENAAQWDTWCRRHGYQPSLVVPGSEPVYLRYPVLVEPEKKRSTAWAVKEAGVQLGVWFVSHVHPIPERVQGCPRADEAVERCVNFPTILQ